MVVLGYRATAVHLPDRGSKSRSRAGCHTNPPSVALNHRSRLSRVFVYTERESQVRFECGGEREGIVQRVNGITRERGLEGQSDPGCGRIVSQNGLYGRHRTRNRTHRVGSSRFGSAPWIGVVSLRVRESRNFTDGNGAPFWIEPAIAPRTSSRKRSRSLGSVMR